MVMMAVTMMMLMMTLNSDKVWTSGVVSSHFRLGWLAGTFILLRFQDPKQHIIIKNSSLVLALVILSLRCLLDTQV